MKRNKLVYLLLMVVIVILLSFILKGVKEEYCLDKVLDKHGIEKPMEGEKWEDFTSCYDSFSLGIIFLYFRQGGW